MKKKLKKLQLKSETLHRLSGVYLYRVQGGSAGPTCADTCGEPETGTCTYATNALACTSGTVDGSGVGTCDSAFPVCVSNNC